MLPGEAVLALVDHGYSGRPEDHGGMLAPPGLDEEDREQANQADQPKPHRPRRAHHHQG